MDRIISFIFNRSDVGIVRTISLGLAGIISALIFIICTIAVGQLPSPLVLAAIAASFLLLVGLFRWAAWQLIGKSNRF